ncbi:MAG: FMN-binding protein [Eubacteriales bacterium]|nr:FMN-binding protein [Eubacteriales bacterium]
MKEKILSRSTTLIAALLVLLMASALFSACSKKAKFNPEQLKDGSYTGEFVDDDENPSRVEVELTIEGGKIIKCEAAEYDHNGNLKAEEYAAISPEAAKAVEGMREYPDLLLKAQDPDTIDAVSGATISLDRFKAAVWDALKKAEN